MNIQFTKTFRKQYQKSGGKTMKAVDAKLRLFMDDPFSPLLNNHALQGGAAGLRSINISGDWRALYSLTIDSQGSQIALFEALGTHSQLYG